jgi:hypothetical protein
VDAVRNLYLDALPPLATLVDREIPPVAMNFYDNGVFTNMWEVLRARPVTWQGTEHAPKQTKKAKRARASSP